MVVALRARDAPQAWVRLAWRGRGGWQHRRYVSFWISPGRGVKGRIGLHALPISARRRPSS